MDYALLLLITLVLGAGVSGGWLSAWGINRRVYTLETELADLQQKHLSEVKKRAGAVGLSHRSQEKEMLAEILHRAQKSPRIEGAFENFPPFDRR